MERSSIFDLVDEASSYVVTVELAKKLRDGKPCAVRVRPLRMGDWLALGEPIPMPSGRGVDEWTAEEKQKYYDFLKRLAPIAVTQARHVGTAPANNGSPYEAFVETWIPLRVIPGGEPNRDRNEITVEELESLGDALARIGNAILTAQDTGGEIGTLPIQEVNPETGEPFRLESGVDSNAGLAVGAANPAA